VIGVDTNVVVRFLTRDDPEQAELARRVMTGGDILLPKTVLLEVEWVLRSAYGYSGEAIGQALWKLLGMDNVVAEDAEAVTRALVWHGGGLDLADALHLASLGEASRLSTFDRELAARAADQDGAPDVELLRPRRTG